MRFNEEGLYRLLEELLRKADKPLDCNQLFENKEIQKYAACPLHWQVSSTTCRSRSSTVRTS